MIESIDRNSAR